MRGKYVGETDTVGSVINGKEYIIIGSAWNDTMYDVVDEYGDNYLYPIEDFIITYSHPWEHIPDDAVVEEKPTRVIVCGGKDINNTGLCFNLLDQFCREHKNVEIVSGHEKGAEIIGERYAKAHDIPLKIFKVKHIEYGSAAGLIINREKLQYALEGVPVVLAFLNGRSRDTKDMIKRANKTRAEVHVVNIPYINNDAGFESVNKGSSRQEKDEVNGKRS